MTGRNHLASKRVIALTQAVHKQWLSLTVWGYRTARLPVGYNVISVCFSYYNYAGMACGLGSPSIIHAKSKPAVDSACLSACYWKLSPVHLLPVGDVLVYSLRSPYPALSRRKRELIFAGDGYWDELSNIHDNTYGSAAGQTQGLPRH